MCLYDTIKDVSVVGMIPFSAGVLVVHVQVLPYRVSIILEHGRHQHDGDFHCQRSKSFQYVSTFSSPLILYPWWALLEGSFYFPNLSLLQRRRLLGRDLPKHRFRGFSPLQIDVDFGYFRQILHGHSPRTQASDERLYDFLLRNSARFDQGKKCWI